MFIMIWATAAFHFWAAEQRVTLSYKKLVAVTLVVSTAKPAIGIIFVVLATDKVTARILGLALVELVGYVGPYISQMWRGKKFFSKKFWAYALCFNLPLVPHYLSQTVLSSADRIMISNMVGSDEAGIYGLAYSISLIMTLFNTALSQTLGPWIYQKIKDERANEIHGIAYGALGIIAAVNILLISFAPEVVAIFAPETYYEAIWIIPLVAMSTFFMFAYDLFAKFEFYYEKTTFIMIASVIGAALNIALNYVFIDLFGYVAAGYTTLFCYVVYAVAHYIFMNRVCEEKLKGLRPYSSKILLLITAVFLAVGFYFLFTYNHLIIRYLSLLVVALILIIKRRSVMNIINKVLGVRGLNVNFL